MRMDAISFIEQVDFAKMQNIRVKQAKEDTIVGKLELNFSVNNVSMQQLEETIKRCFGSTERLTIKE